MKTSSNKRGSKRNIRRPKRYEDTVVTGKEGVKNKSIRNDDGEDDAIGSKEADAGVINDGTWVVDDEGDAGRDVNEEVMCSNQKDANEIRGASSDKNVTHNEDSGVSCDKNVFANENMSTVYTNSAKNNMPVEKPEMPENSGQRSYASMVKNDVNNVNKNLIFIAPKLSEEAKVCQFGSGRTDYARVLVELNARKVIKESIRIEYADQNTTIKGTKDVTVVYDWKPELCTYCNVFGHCNGKCNKRPRSEEEIKAGIEAEKVAKQVTEEKKQQWQHQYKNGGYRNGVNRQEYRKKAGPINVEKKANDKDQNIRKDDNTMQGNKGKTNSTDLRSKEKDNNAAKSSNGNRFEALNTIVVEDDAELRILQGRTIVDSFLNKRVKPSDIATEMWTDDMHKYFNDQWEVDRLKEKDDMNGNKEEVYENENGIPQTLTTNIVNGMSKDILN
ncbi:hypothetical protein CTI12_AA183530 [Artemisia annua]|uniref:Zinc knuckle CX2CX4HX4C n=1 Tax=Artemisia annua TaxID=35608 RepID=A0A2U1P873_ARTAN|nr:hypothetical protein CTI12_AA183530 [Artemisia annua]